jgi:hypothetical protein
MKRRRWKKRGEEQKIEDEQEDRRRWKVRGEEEEEVEEEGRR